MVMPTAVLSSEWWTRGGRGDGAGDNEIVHVWADIDKGVPKVSYRRWY